MNTLKWNFFKFFAILILLPSLSFGQYYIDWESEEIDQFYKKYDLPIGTLDEGGEDISFVFIETDLEKGMYEIEIEDYSGDLYQIKNTELYVKFTGYYGYAGYGDEGILVVRSTGSKATFYKEPNQ